MPGPSIAGLRRGKRDSSTTWPAASRSGHAFGASQRRKGCGTRLLALILERARERGIRRALVTCLTDNLASARVIERNGGVCHDVIDSPPMGGPIRRYWIDL